MQRKFTYSTLFIPYGVLWFVMSYALFCLENNDMCWTFT